MRAAVMCVLILLGSLRASAQAPPAGSSALPARPLGQPVDVSELPIDLGRIQSQLARPQDINLSLLRPTFRVSVIERRPRWFDEIDWLEQVRGVPTPTGPAWHDEFLNMVTPQEARPYGAFDSGQLAQVATTSLIEALTANTVVNAIKGAVRNRKEAEAKREVDEAIEQWKREQERRAP